MGTEEKASSKVVSVVVQKNQSKYDRTFTIEGEGHTLGHALSSVIRTQVEVKFCGYAIPHPTNSFFELKITMDREASVSSKEALIKGLQDLREATIQMEKVFEVAVSNYDAPLDAER